MPRKLTKFISSVKSKIVPSSGSRSNSAASNSGRESAASYESYENSPSQDAILIESEQIPDNDGQASQSARSSFSSVSTARPVASAAGTPSTSGARTPAAEALDLPPPFENPSNGFLRNFWKNFRTNLTSSSGYGELAPGVGASAAGPSNADVEKDPNTHWWASKRQRVLFGTWNGVFITCVVHLFGVISFLRTGWLVGNEGILISGAIVFGCLLFTTISLLAAIGIMDRCAAALTSAQSQLGKSFLSSLEFEPEYQSTVASARANVHLLISTVLGSRIGASISLIYCFGQAVSCALHVNGFSETFVKVLENFIQNNFPLETLEELRDNSKLPVNNTTTQEVEFSLLQSTAVFIARYFRFEFEISRGSPNIVSLIVTPQTYQILSGIAILVLLLINIAGVRSIFRLQWLLFLSLTFAMADFALGLLSTHDDFGYGPMEWRIATLEENLHPQDSPRSAAFWSHLFVSIGVFFPSSIGVMAGVNMGADLHTPTRSIPIGSLSAILSSYALHLLFIVGLGSMCARNALLNDFAVAQHVSASGLFLQFGLYMSALSSSLGSMYTAPRILQNVAQEFYSVPVVKYLSCGVGPNKTPVFGLILFSGVTLLFVMVGGINVLAPIVTIPYLLTYGAIEYAYFSMAMTFDIQIAREKRFMSIVDDLRKNGNSSPEMTDVGQSQLLSPNSTIATSGNGGTKMARSCSGITIDQTDVTSLRESQNEDSPKSPTPSIQHLNGYGTVQSVTTRIKITRRQSTQSDSDDESGDDGGSAFGSFRSSMKKLETQRKNTKPKKSPETETKDQTKPEVSSKSSKKRAKTIRQLMAAESDDDEDDDDEEEEDPQNNHPHFNKNSVFRFETSSMTSLTRPASTQPEVPFVTKNLPSDDEENVEESLLKPDPEAGDIGCKSELWYLRLMNRWTVLGAALLKFSLMFAIAWHYALVTLVAFVIFYIIIGKTNPGHYPGVSEFSILQTFRGNWARFCNGFCILRSCSSSLNKSTKHPHNLVASFSCERIVIPPTSMPNPNYRAEQLTTENSDYLNRENYHSATVLKSQFNE